MIDYSKGKIYCIEPICEHEEGERYIGSTTKHYLSDRYFFHRMSYDKYKVGYGGRYSAYDLFDKYGYLNCQILLLENVDVSSKEELRMREGYYIRNMKCVNKRIAGRTKEEYKLEKKEMIIQERKDYYEQNKEHIDSVKGDCTQKSKDKAKQTRDAANILIDCPCGSKYLKYDLSRHNKTIKHKKFEAFLNGDVVEPVIVKLKYPERQEYRKANSDIVKCPCGSAITKYKMCDHIKSKKHQTYFQNNINNSINETD